MHNKAKYAVFMVLFAFFVAAGFGLVHAYADGPAQKTAQKEKPAAPIAAPDQNLGQKIDDLRVTPDKTAMVRLNTDAASVVVTNPAHAVVQLESPRLLVIMPREPGTTGLTVLDRHGKVILQKNIIVTAAQQHYVRVRRACGAQDPSCVPSAYFYCPDGCYEVTPVAGDGVTPEAPPMTGNAPDVMPQDNGTVQNGQPIPQELPADPSTINITDDDVSPEELTE
jgi:hypothetical protein